MSVPVSGRRGAMASTEPYGWGSKPVPAIKYRRCLCAWCKCSVRIPKLTGVDWTCSACREDRHDVGASR